jgi:hypothetical protein
MEIGEPAKPVLPSPASKPKDLEPTITASWRTKAVEPVRNVTFPPASPPTDVRCVQSAAPMLVMTTNVPDGTKATITVHHCFTQMMVKDGKLDNLEVRAGRVVDKTTGFVPEFSFEAKHKPWDPWDKPFFFFRVQLSHRGLTAETPRDFRGKPDQVLRVLCMSVCVGDEIADTAPPWIDKTKDPPEGLRTGDEAITVAGLLEGPASTAHITMFNAAEPPTALWGSVLRNTYAYHQGSHGLAFNDREAIPPAMEGTELAPVGPVQWQSAMVLGHKLFVDRDVQSGDVPSVPRYLVYLDCCLSGYEPSFANAFLGRGTQNVIAFRKVIYDDDATFMAEAFHQKWARHSHNPRRIPQIFWDVGSPNWAEMRPVLYGMGGGQISRTRAINRMNEAIWEVRAGSGP